MSVQKFLILRVVDCFATTRVPDRTGYELYNSVYSDFPDAVLEFLMIPSDEAIFDKTLFFYCDVLKFSVVLISGSPGFSQSRLIPETITKIKNIEANGISTALYMECFKVLPAAMYARLTCGFRNKSLLMTFPEISFNLEICYNIVRPILINLDKPLYIDECRVRAQKKSEKMTDEQSTMEANKNKVICIPRIEIKNEPKETKIKTSDEIDIEKAKEQCKMEQDFLDLQVTNELRGANQEEVIQSLLDLQKAYSNPTEKKVRFEPPSENPYKINKSVATNSTIIVKTLDDAINTVVNTLQHNLIRQVKMMPVSDSRAFTVVDSIHAIEPYPSAPSSAIDGYAGSSKSEACLRKVCDINKLEEDNCAIVKKGQVLPQNVDWVIAHEDVNYDETDNSITLKVMPNKNDNINQIGCHIKANDFVVERGKVIGKNEIGMLLTVGVKHVPVYSYPKIRLFYIVDENDKDDRLIKSNNTILANILREQNFKCYNAKGKIYNEYVKMKIAISEAFKTYDIVIVQIKNTNLKYLLTGVLWKEFKGQPEFSRLDIKNGKLASFTKCIFKGKDKYVFALSDSLHSAMIISRLLIFPALMYWIGNQNPKFSKINVQITHDVALFYKPHYVRAYIKYSSLHQCPKATIIEPPLNSLDLRSLEEVILELPETTMGKKFISKGSLIPAFLIG